MHLLESSNESRSFITLDHTFVRVDQIGLPHEDVVQHDAVLRDQGDDRDQGDEQHDEHVDQLTLLGRWGYPTNPDIAEFEFSFHELVIVIEVCLHLRFICLS